MLRDDGRYRINDEPAKMPPPGFQLLVFLSLPLTVFLTISYSFLFLAIPGAVGIFIGGRHRWFDPLMSALSIVLLIALGLVLMGTLGKGESVHLLLVYFTQDLSRAIVFLPVFYSVMQQQRTLQLREAAAL